MFGSHSSSPLRNSKNITKMVLTPYGASYSTRTKCVAVVLKERDIPFAFVSIDLLKGEAKLPEFLKKQPFGQVPYIVSGIRCFYNR